MGLDAKTRSMLEEWETKYGLDGIQERLDSGLFSNDPEKQRLCYVWVKGKRLAPTLLNLWRLVIGLTAIAGSVFGVLSYFKS